MPFQLLASNALERLSDQLISRLSLAMATADLDALFNEQIVIVPTVGLRDWLRQRIASELGICAGIRFCYPGEFFHWLGEQIGSAQASNQWSSQALWLCLKEQQHIAELAPYLAPDGKQPGQRSYALASALVECFDRYALYRPQWLEAWSQGKQAEHDADAPWQPVLWRRLMDAGLADPIQAHRELVTALQQPQASLPPEIHAFGFNNISPRLLEISSLLGQQRDLWMYSLQPTWGDWHDQRSQRKVLRDGDDLASSEDNRLLGDWGEIGKDFLKQIDDAGAEYHSDDEDFFQPPTDTLLHRIQSDLYHVQSAWTDGEHTPAKDDHSLRAHACHDLRRQLEVVKEQIHLAFAELPDLQAHDVAIMTPEPETVGPLAAALFSSASHGPELPVVVADRTQRHVNAAAEACGRLITLLPGRMTAHAIYEFIGTTAIAEAWGLGANQLATIQSWIDEADLRWGVDAAHRQEITGFAFSAGSWLRGMQRLQLAWWYGEDTDRAQAFVAAESDAADAVIPVKNFSPSDFETLTLLSQLLEPILADAAQARAGAGIDWWREHLLHLVKHVLRLQDDDADLAQVGNVLGTWASLLHEQGWDEDVSHELVSAHLSSCFGGAVGGDFARGAITICGLQPMRSIPFRMLCLVGMDDGVFPRQASGIDADLMRLHPQPGDRDLRREDRYLMLELLFSVRDRLCLTYTGFEGRDNASLPPASIVGELLDVAAQTTNTKPENFITQHRLHRSLEQPAWPDADIAAEHQALHGERQQSRFIPPTIPSIPLATIDLSDLVRFWSSPAKAYLRNLGVQLLQVQEPPRDHERFTSLSGLDRYQAASELLHWHRDEEAVAIQSMQERLAAEGWLPPGALADQAWHQLHGFVHPLLLQQGTLDACEPLAGNIPLAKERTLTCSIPWIHATRGVIQIHPGSERPKRVCELWLQLLAAACLNKDITTATLFAIDSKKQIVHEVELQLSDDPFALLADLVAGFDAGQTKPLPFDLDLSSTYTQQRWQKKAKTHAAALSAALHKGWLPGFNHAGDSTTPENRLLWPDELGPGADAGFADWAQRITRPMWVAAGKALP